MMTTIDINYTAIALAVVVNMVIGYVWYAPQVFGKAWMKMNGLSKSDTQKSSMTSLMLFMLVLAIVQAFVLKHFTVYVASFYPTYSAASVGFLTGVWAWIGFVLPVMGASYMFAGRRKKLLLIDSGYYIVALPIMGMILTHWL